MITSPPSPHAALWSASRNRVPAPTRTVAAPSTISIIPAALPGRAVSAGGRASGIVASNITGVKVTPPSLPRRWAICLRASRRQPNNCCELQPISPRDSRDLVSALVALGQNPPLFCSGVHARRRPEPVKTSSRRTASGLVFCKSSVCDTCLTRSTQQRRTITLSQHPGRCGLKVAYPKMRVTPCFSSLAGTFASWPHPALFGRQLNCGFRQSIPSSM